MPSSRRWPVRSAGRRASEARGWQRPRRRSSTRRWTAVSRRGGSARPSVQRTRSGQYDRNDLCLGAQSAGHRATEVRTAEPGRLSPVVMPTLADGRYSTSIAIRLAAMITQTSRNRTSRTRRRSSRSCPDRCRPPPPRTPGPATPRFHARGHARRRRGAATPGHRGRRHGANGGDHDLPGNVRVDDCERYLGHQLAAAMRVAASTGRAHPGAPPAAHQRGSRRDMKSGRWPPAQNLT